MPCVTYSLWKDVRLTYFTYRQICPGCKYCYDCLRESTFQFEVGCVLFCSKAVVKNKYDMSYVMYIQGFFFFCMSNEYYIILSFVFYTCIWWPLHLDVRKKCIYVSVVVSVISQMSCKISAYWISARNSISCIPTKNKYSLETVRWTLETSWQMLPTWVAGNTLAA